MRKWKILICLLMMSVCILPGLPGTHVQAKKRPKIKVLWIGNSLTKGRVIPYVQALGKAGGFTICASRVAYGGEKLYHYADPDSPRGREVRKMIKKKKWDYVVIQEHTDWAIAQPGIMKQSIVTLAELVKKNSRKTKILMNCTWAYNYTRRRWGESYSYSRQRKLMNSHYEKAKKAVRKIYREDKKVKDKDKADIIRSGKSFAAYMKIKGHADLYRPDGNHPSHAGAYMNACCIYAKLTGSSPVGNPFRADLNAKTARAIQKKAAKYNYSS